MAKMMYSETVNSAASINAKYFTTESKGKKDRALYRKQIADGWMHVEKGERYQRFALKESCYRITDNIKEEMMDGIFLSLNERNDSKPYSVQKRTLRRIAEKRQAQAVHHTIGHTHNSYAQHMTRTSVSKCMEAIRRRQLCA